METKPYDVAEQLRTEEERALYLEAVREQEGCTDIEYRKALLQVMRSRALHPNPEPESKI